MSATQRSKKYLTDQGYKVEIVERWNPHARIRQDLFGFADLLAIKPGELPLLVQVTTTGWASRVDKVQNEPNAALALQSGFLIHVHGWRKLKSNRGRWTIKEIPIALEDCACHIPPSG